MSKQSEIFEHGTINCLLKRSKIDQGQKNSARNGTEMSLRAYLIHEVLLTIKILTIIFGTKSA